MPDMGMAVGRQMSRFAMVGVLNTVVGVAVIFLMYRGFGFGLVLSNAVGYGVGLVLSFVLNGSWTFGAASYQFATILKYAIVVAMAFMINILLIQTLISFNTVYWLAQLSGVVMYSALVFLGMKYAVFTK